MAKRGHARPAAIGIPSAASPAPASTSGAVAAARPPIDIEVLTGFLNSLESYSQDLVQHLRSGQKLCHYTTLGGAAKSDQIYICCFCQRDNLLSQWRGYADNGGGVSFEFDPVGFTDITGRDCPHGLMRLWKVFYDRAQQRQILQKCIEYPHWPSQTDSDRIRFVVDALQFFMPTFKNADFQEEQERRLIFTPYPAMSVLPRFRARSGLLVPYFSLRDVAGPGATGFHLPISSVLVGPSLHRSLNVESTRLLLQKHKYGTVPVAASTTPYRP